MLSKLDYMNSQSEKVQTLTEEYEALEMDHRSCLEETKQRTKVLRKVISINAKQKKEIQNLEKQSIKVSEELESKTKRLNILMKKFEKLNKNIEVCDNLEKKYEAI